jgi:hypothetical protein
MSVVQMAGTPASPLGGSRMADGAAVRNAEGPKVDTWQSIWQRQPSQRRLRPLPPLWTKFV